MMRLIILVIAGMWIASGPAAWAASTGTLVREANGAYRRGDYRAAAQKYEKALQKKPDSAIINFNLGTAEYKGSRYGRALDHLQQAFLSNRRGLQEKAHYNAGNALYRLALGQENKDLSGAVSGMKKALVQYNETLGLNPKDGDALFNRKLAREQLKRLQKKLKQRRRQERKSGSSQTHKPNGKKQKKSSAGRQEHQHRSSASGRSQPKKQQKNGKSQESSAGSKKQTAPQNRQGRKKPTHQPAGQGQSRPSSGAPSPTGQPQGQAGSREMTPQEARDLINNYQQTEEPRGLLNFLKGKRKEVPVLKNW